jgi:hypothetical protein
MRSRPFYSSTSLSLSLMAIVSSFSIVLSAIEEASAQVVVAVTGTVEWKPPGGTQFNTVARNMTLSQGSLLRLEQGASVTISCPDGDPKDLTTPGTTGLNQICPPARTTSGRIITPRNGTRDIPYAILPRATAILTNEPTLRWNAATGADSFTVTVRGQGLTWTEQVDRADVCNGQSCELKYSGEPLQPGTSYRLVIEADNGRSSAEETTGGLGFKLLDTTEATEVNQIIDRIEVQNLSDVARAIALANLYASHNLISEAIQSLEAVPQPEKIAAVYRQLGDLYQQIGLPLEAEVQYLTAIELAEANDNILELATAQAGLGEVYYTLGRREEAAQRLQAAQKEYEKLGDAERATELEQRLAQVRP